MTFFLSGTIGGQHRKWPLDDHAVITLGRSSRSTIQLVDATVSKEHAEIARSDDRWRIRDRGSRNGTRVNGVTVDGSQVLEPGDRIEVGHVPLLFTDGEPGEPTVLSESSGLSSSLKIPAARILMTRSGERSDAAGMVHLLAEAGQLLVLPRPLKETCGEILRVVEQAVPANRLMLLLRPGPGAEPVQMAVRFRTSNTTQPLALSRTIMKMVLDENTSVMTTDAAADPRFQGQHSIVAHAVHSAMAVPLFDNTNVLGILYADSNDIRTSFSQEHLEVLTLLANMAAVKITNARLLETEQQRLRMIQELATATGIQKSLLPPTPDVEGYQIRAYLETCHEVGGDLYDFNVNADGTLYFLLGDVSGKGLGAAMLMSSVMASARALYDGCPDPVDLMTRLNAIIHRSTDPGHFLTAFLGRLDPGTGRLTYVNAGHNPPYIVSGGAIREIEATGIPVGMMPQFPYASGTVELSRRSLFVLFTDGVPEANREGEFFEEERLKDILLESEGLPEIDDVCRGIIGRVDDFLAGEPRGDDLTLLLIRRN